MYKLSVPTSRAEIADSLLGLMRFAFMAYLLTAPFGMAFREIFGTTAVASLLLYYCLDYSGSRLRRLPLRWIVFAFFGFLLFKTAHSISPEASRYAMWTAGHKSLPLFLAGLEALRKGRQVVLCAVLIMVMGFFQGVDGVYQYFVGVDFIKGDPIDGHRLTGTLTSARVGNLMSLILPMYFALPAVLSAWRPNLRSVFASIASACALSPALFLFVGAAARSGFVGFVAACGSASLLRFGVKRTLGLAGAGVVAVLAAGSLLISDDRFTLRAMQNDPRWELWGLALAVFRAYPLLGSGINTFDIAFRGLGIQPQQVQADVNHPHNIYMQFLAEGGAVGLLVLLLFLGGMLIHCGRILFAERGRSWPPLRTVAVCAWASYFGYMVTAATAHGFFRTWWLGMAMAILGVALAGAELLRADKDDR